MVKSLTFQQLTLITQGQTVLQDREDQPVRYISTDSRKIIHGQQTLFIALKGFKVDGHDYLKDAYEKGVRLFIVQKPLLLNQFPGIAVLQVNDGLKALQAIAKWNRKQFGGTVIGITGSNGKTIIKEWLGQVLASKFALAKSPKSYNSQTGVPLSIFGIEEYHKAAIIEAGISQVGEMARLERIIQPDIGILTNIGTAHAEGFSSQEQKLKEKIKLFNDAQLIIYRKDHPLIHRILQEHFAPSRLVAWSEYAGADYTLSIKKNNNGSKITLIKPDLGIFTFHSPFTDEASLENLRHTMVASLVLGLPEPEIQQVIPGLNTVEMRLTLKSGIHQCLLIDDTYNNDLAGLDIALEFMNTQRPKKRKILMLSDLLQAGKKEDVYNNVRALVRHYQVDMLLGVGQEISQLEENPPCESHFYQDTDQLLEALGTLSFQDDLILIKGARMYRFEQIVDALQERLHGTVLEINLNALRRNFTFYKSQLKPSTKVMIMVKAFAYGGGATEIAHHLQQLNADYLAVAYTDEGVSLRQEQINLPIMVLNPAPESFGNLVKYQLEPVVYSLSFFRQLGAYCHSNHTSLKIHLDLDTGMHRLGFGETDLEALREMITAYPSLKVASMYTHLAGADEADHEEYTKRQLSLFEAMCKTVKGFLGYSPLVHALNSAGIVRYPDFQMDMVRLGIGLYGVEVNGLHQEALQPVSVLKTTISQLKSLKKGETVGYGRKGVMASDGQIATIAIGYADGYDRRFSNGKGQVLIHGKKAAVIGNVCMDMTMIEVTGMDVHEGDEVIIYGEGLSLKEQATAIGTIPYELLTNISSRVKRVYFMD
ncbi:bifunctional UDP-N-acetylmuramoyl-tripeptide:D-alanyl-D-alanine ligase/alanine racemase [Echinicola strongylocentroti]|uniref:Alanine racemase n=1 Tax=Echinicola strongylocentroti TaxID=1795355 RepID=A0A2Z4IJ10_9BACT|nr:bifunctional UDP-N-acetylmuramoyl-tripeptide:D-alanyl-D-alanine ligase/alanine racemase [Echinicola strongylocentroti]AWW30526.1 bifunctional UDP-N-acetylmuramoyl-tripeptide:D-alanyl-D-alanine ligase/alanine racemase [Echinicola strongylocentroti]